MDSSSVRVPMETSIAAASDLGSSVCRAKATSTSSRQFSSRDMAAQTKLKFRQPGQGTKDEVTRRDLRLELEVCRSLSAP